MTEYGYQLQQGVEFFQKLSEGYATLEAMVRASNGSAATAQKVPDTSSMTTKELRQLVNEHDLDVDLDDYDDIDEKREAVANALSNAAKKAPTAHQAVEDEDDDPDEVGSGTVDFSVMKTKALKQFVEDHELDVDVDDLDDEEDLREAVEVAYLAAAGEDDTPAAATKAADDEDDDW